MKRPTNRLAQETSPYLLQHAHNPVEWYPWGEEALERARKEDRPILLSIGYSACHWCHVMERESFENESIADLMNRQFICIKVDREERPDLDQIYMNAVQMMTGSGGWPLTVFLTPEGAPFYGGTYFPPDERWGRPGFPRLLDAMAEAYRNRRNDVVTNGRIMLEQMNRPGNRPVSGAALDSKMLDQSAKVIVSRFDPQLGGITGAPKFPPAMAMDFLLRYHHRTQSENALVAIRLTLDHMAYGGIYDHVGGGFHRYSVDDRWLVPHFEKMLYDNALLVRIYLDAHRVTGTPLYRRVAEETLDYVVREMRDPAGGFYSAQDADSEGVEGRFYVWGLDEFEDVVGGDAGLIARFWGVTESGNFEERNILNVPRDLELFCRLEKVSREDFQLKLDEARRKLYEVRSKRVWPGRDDKILTDWNGLMLRAFAEAAASLSRPDYRSVAETNAAFLLSRMWNGQTLLHGYKDGRARFNAYLDDYANLADGLVALYQLTFEERWLEHALALAERMLDQFWDPQEGGFFFTARDHEKLITRTKDYFDNANPSGNSVAADVLLKLAALCDRPEFRARAERIFDVTAPYMDQYPAGMGRMLSAVDFFVGPAREIAIAGDPSEFLPVIRRHYLPRSVVAAGSSASILLLRNRPLIDGKPTAFVCENFACRQPVTDPEALDAQIREP